MKYYALSEQEVAGDRSLRQYPDLINVQADYL